LKILLYFREGAAKNTSLLSKDFLPIYQEGELNESATVSKMETVQKEGNREVVRTIEFYNSLHFIKHCYFWRDIILR